MTSFNNFIALVYSIKDIDLLEDFLMGVTTQKERQELTQRVEIMKRLLKGEPQHHIAADIGVGIATVTRGSKELALGRFKILREKQ